MSNLKNRVSRLEKIHGENNLAGVIIYFKNVRRDCEHIISADCYANKNADGKKMSLAEVKGYAKTHNHTYITYLPLYRLN